MLKTANELTEAIKQKVHSLTEAQKAAKVQKCRQLFAWHAGDDIAFSDEKQFLLQ
jgi:hypothetical protein